MVLGGAKQKFKLDMPAPSEQEIRQIQKVETKLLAPKMTVKKPEGTQSSAIGNRNNQNQHVLSKASMNQASGASLHEKRVADNFARPMALKEKT